MTPTPGWYQDPWGHAGQVRYWDGQRWLAAPSPPPPPEALSPQGQWWPSDWSTWPCPRNVIAGEASYQYALMQLVGQPRDVGYLVPVTVTLVREPANPYDRNAIRGDVNGVTVGYLRRQIAAQMADALDQCGCRGFSVCGLVRGREPVRPQPGLPHLDRQAALGRPKHRVRRRLMERPVAAAPWGRASPLSGATTWPRTEAGRPREGARPPARSSRTPAPRRMAHRIRS